MIERTQAALQQIPVERRLAGSPRLLGDSIPLAMAHGCQYEAQFHEASRLVAEGVRHANWQIAYQSRSGPPSQPWLGPDISETLRKTRTPAQREPRSPAVDVVVVPIGFVSDHIEVCTIWMKRLGIRPSRWD